MFVSLAVAFYLLIPQLADVSGVWSKLKEADWTWALYALGASALTYVGATIGLLGAAPRRLPFIGTFGTVLAGSFVNRIVPARVGGIATNVRFLQKQGLDLAVASSSVGLQQLAGLLTHLSLSVVFLLWAGRSGIGAFDFLPSGTTVLIGLTAVLALSGLLFLLPAGRGVLRKRVLPILRRSGQGIGDVARRPFKLAELFGGSLFLTLSYIAALVFSVHAFGPTGVSVASIGVVFLVGSATRCSSIASPRSGCRSCPAGSLSSCCSAGATSERAGHRRAWPPCCTRPSRPSSSSMALGSPAARPLARSLSTLLAVFSRAEQTQYGGRDTPIGRSGGFHPR